MIPSIFLVFDVEAAGIHGEGYAVGYIVKDREGNKLEEGCFSCPPNSVRGSQGGFEWIRANVPEIKPTHDSAWMMRAAFWRRWREWQGKGAVLVADCAWPVEARFLLQCVDDHPNEREWQGPYPLYDLSSVMLANGVDPLSANPRIEEELPPHHPLCDAKQSARLLIALIGTPTASPKPTLKPE